MKYLLLLSLLISTLGYAQSPGDTIIVSSIDYSMTYGVGDRDTLVYFPTDPNLKFEKILMLYSMRCKNGLVSPPVAGQTNIGCGEWDYSCNTYIEDPNKADSVARTTTSHDISGFSGSSFDYSTFPVYDYSRRVYTHTDLSTVVSENAYSSGTYTTDINHCFPIQHFDAKSQYLYTASELTAAGLTAGNIDGFFMFLNNTISADFCSIKIKHTSASQVTASMGADTSGFTEVFFDELNAYAFSTGHRVLFSTPFSWDGVSNILVDFSYTNLTGNGGFTIPTIEGETKTNSGVFASGAQYPYFDGTNYMTVDGYKGVGGADNRTIEAWVKTSAANNEIVSWGQNSSGKKWIVRVNGGGQLRAEVAGGYIVGTTNLTDDKWHHVACVLNGNSVSNIQLYVDGNLEAISSSQNISINTDANGSDVSIGHGHNNTYFVGNIDNVRIWSTALSAATIADWKNAQVNSSHPDFSSLELNLSKDSIQNNTWLDLSANARDASMSASFWMDRSTGEELHDNFQVVNERPVLDFVRGYYIVNTSLDSVWLQRLQRPSTVTYKSITSNAGTTMNDEITTDSTNSLWNSSLGFRYYAEDGTLELTSPAPVFGTITPTTLPWWERNPMRFEIMSFVTPYGINLDLGPEGKTWTFDLTDFTPLLKGTRRMIMNKGGQWQEDMDIKFLFIVGTPTRDVLSIDNIWKTDRQVSYNDINTEKYFAPRNVTPHAGASLYEIRSSITGHGQEGEFVPRDHFLQKDGTTVNNWQVWKTCGDNPIYPQGGTWIYDRAGWCPGMATDIRRTPLSGVTGPMTLDYGITTATGDSRYIVSHQLVSYGPLNHSLDAEITDIINPTKKVENTRSNPGCSDPLIHIKNNGSTAISSMTIEYGVNGASHKSTYNWSGSLASMEEAAISLPAYATNIWQDIDRDSNNVFYAKVLDVNGSADDNEHNSYAQSKFDLPEIFPPSIALLIRTNNAPQETNYEIIDMSGNAVFSKSYTDGSSNKRDTANLGKGCYTLRITDTGGDGIDFWANNDGIGSISLKNALNGTTIAKIEGDFGNYYELQFTVDWPLSYTEHEQLWDVSLYPNPAHTELFVEGQQMDKAEVEIVDMLGRSISLPIERQSDLLEFDLSGLPAGVYIFNARSDNKRFSKKFTVAK